MQITEGVKLRRLENRIALVTGGASGIGLACAKRLQSEGAILIVTDLQVERGESVASEHGFTFIEQDVASEAAWACVKARIEADHGHLDILVNNAAYVGRSEFSSPENTGIDDMRKVFAVNVEGVLLGCQVAIALMRKKGAGSIINISSIGALVPTPTLTAYGASKAAVLHLTKSVAQHCAQQGLQVRCNAVHPGTVRTEMWENHVQETARVNGVSFEEAASFWTSRIPLGQLQEPEDLAAAVAFLASDDSRFITASKIVVDGGSTSA
jgi:3(or 17)beta-hydroxysteroid dehydrogenase